MPIDCCESSQTEVYHPQQVLIKNQGFAEKLLYLFFRSASVQQIIPDSSELCDHNFKWLTLRSQSVYFAIGISDFELNPLAMLRVLKFLRAEIDPGFKIASDCFDPAEFGKFKVLSYKLHSAELNSRVLIVFTENLSLPYFPGSALGKADLKLPLLIPCDLPQASGDFSMLADQICIGLPSAQESGGIKTFVCKPGGENGFFCIVEEGVMDLDSKIKSVVRLGSIEMNIEQLLELRAGSQISFKLPEKSLVELELAGKIIGRGILENSEDGRFKIEIILVNFGKGS